MEKGEGSLAVPVGSARSLRRVSAREPAGHGRGEHTKLRSGGGRAALGHGAALSPGAAAAALSLPAEPGIKLYRKL